MIKYTVVPHLGFDAFFQTLTSETYVLVEATITTFSFIRLFKNRVKEAIIFYYVNTFVSSVHYKQWYPC